MTRSELYSKIMKKCGITAQTLMLAEECSELIKACSKMARDPDIYKRLDIIEEVADTLIMIEQIMRYYHITMEEVTIIENEKLNRLEERLEKGDLNADTGPEKS